MSSRTELLPGPHCVLSFFIFLSYRTLSWSETIYSQSLHTSHRLTRSTIFCRHIITPTKLSPQPDISPYNWIHSPHKQLPFFYLLPQLVLHILTRHLITVLLLPLYSTCITLPIHLKLSSSACFSGLFPMTQ